jgi:hypothetical protein
LRFGPSCPKRRCYSQQVGRHEDTQHDCRQEPGLYYRDRDNSKVVGERAPNLPPEHDPEGYADDDPDAYQRCRLPGDGGNNLAVHEAECLQKAYLASSVRDATTSKWTSVAAPDKANIPPKISGKLTASPKLTRDVGVIGSAVIDW